MVKKADVIIVSAVLLFSLFFAYLSWSSSVKGGNKTAYVYVDGKKEYVFSLNDKKKQDNVRIECENGYNEIALEGGSIYVKDADCGGKDCVKKGKISQIGDIIICAPHKIMIKIEKTAGDDDVSAITY